MRIMAYLIAAGLALVVVFATNLVVQNFVFMVVSLSITLAVLAVLSALAERYIDSIRYEHYSLF